MRFGVGDFSGQRSPGTRPHSELYQELLDQAKRLDAAGIDSMWVSEHHFAEDGYMPSVLVICAALLAATSRLQVGTDRLLASLYDPIRLAEDAAALDLLSRGRFVLGLSLTYRDEELAPFGVARPDDVGRLEEIASLIRTAWAGPLDHRGHQFRPLRVSVTPPPFTAGGPRLMMAADGGPTEGARRAARLADILMVDPTESWDAVRAAVAAFDEARGDHAGEVAVFAYGAISERGRPEAWRRIETGFGHMRHTYDSWMGLPPTRQLPPPHYRMLLGTPDEVAEEARRYRAELGDRAHLVLRLNYPGMEHDEVLRQIDLWGRVAERVR